METSPTIDLIYGWATISRAFYSIEPQSTGERRHLDIVMRQNFIISSSLIALLYIAIWHQVESTFANKIYLRIFLVVFSRSASLDAAVFVVVVCGGQLKLTWPRQSDLSATSSFIDCQVSLLHFVDF